jgi:CheY-like chemotaxis protein
MSRLGLEVMIAGDGAQAVRLFGQWAPDLIWMDRRMPVMDGIEATYAIRQQPGGDAVKIVAVTASVFKEQQEEMLIAGMDGFVHKPYRFNEIYDAMAEQLELEYVYTSATTAEEEMSADSLSAVNLAALPVPLREELHSALENLDSETIRRLILQVGEIDQNLSLILSRYADNFAYPTIIDALTAVKEEAQLK